MDSLKMAQKHEITALDVAKFFLGCVDDDAGDNISHLKLQKLVYYAQGFHLAMFGVPFFNENVLAWEHGPVVKSVYAKYRKSGSNGIPPEPDFDETIFNAKQIELLQEVCTVYGQFSAWKLRNMTHAEKPYTEAKNGYKELISQETMKEFFKTQLHVD